MAAQEVNPPPQIVLPEEFKKDLSVVNYFEQLERMLLQLWTRTGGSQDAVDAANTDFKVNLVSSIFDIREQIGSGIPVTIDTTGFTVDNTEQTTDMSEM